MTGHEVPTLPLAWAQTRTLLQNETTHWTTMILFVKIQDFNFL